MVEKLTEVKITGCFRTATRELNKKKAIEKAKKILFSRLKEASCLDMSDSFKFDVTEVKAKHFVGG